jgi:hypothetical protein
MNLQTAKAETQEWRCGGYAAASGFSPEIDSRSREEKIKKSGSGIVTRSSLRPCVSALIFSPDFILNS